jgi:hypothetical protein
VAARKLSGGYDEGMADMLEIAKRIDLFFMGKSPVHDTMQRLATALREINVPFAIAGAMAANAHGYLRTTADVDILLTRENLTRFKDRWSGLGWVDLLAGSKSFRDTANNVKVDVLVTGEYPGDGLPKPVSFPDPETVAVLHGDGLPYIDLPTLLNLKLASGISAKHRLQDLADVIHLIRINELKPDYAERLNPYVREKFVELWPSAQIHEDF